tara:strand:- start:1155 stop:1826 length:672 start_codon:yes stop_codon:yes gene_type:complete
MVLVLACACSDPTPEAALEVEAEQPTIIIEDVSEPSDGAETDPIELPPPPPDVVVDVPEAIEPHRVGSEVVEGVLLNLADLSPTERALADEVARRTAEEITTRGPLGGGVWGLSAPQWVDLLQTLSYALIVLLGGAIANALRRLYGRMSPPSGVEGEMVSLERLREQESIAAELRHQLDTLREKLATDGPRPSTSAPSPSQKLRPPGVRDFRAAGNAEWYGEK